MAPFFARCVRGRKKVWRRHSGTACAKRTWQRSRSTGRASIRPQIASTLYTVRFEVMNGGAEDFHAGHLTGSRAMQAIALGIGSRSVACWRIRLLLRFSTVECRRRTHEKLWTRLETPNSFRSAGLAGISPTCLELLTSFRSAELAWKCRTRLEAIASHAAGPHGGGLSIGSTNKRPSLVFRPARLDRRE